MREHGSGSQTASTKNEDRHMEHRLAKPTVEPKCAFWKRERFSLYQLRKMYSIYQAYYENTNFELFISDFNKKTGAFGKSEQVASLSLRCYCTLFFGYSLFDYSAVLPVLNENQPIFQLSGGFIPSPLISASPSTRSTA